jgi:hypothetical protein
MYSPKRVSRQVKDWDLIITMDSLISRRLDREYEIGDRVTTLRKISGTDSDGDEDIVLPFDDYDYLVRMFTTEVNKYKKNFHNARKRSTTAHSLRV